MILYSLDNSDAACRSEDYPCGNRLAFQLNIVRTVSRAVLAPQQGQQNEGNNSASPQLAVVSSAGRPQLSVPPTTSAAALLGFDVNNLTSSNGERCQFLGALRLALLAVKRSAAGRVLAFLSSQADLPAEQCRQLSRSFAEAGVPLDVVLLCPEDELPPDQVASLEFLTAAAVYDNHPGGGTAAATAAAGPQRPGLQRHAPRTGVATLSASSAERTSAPAAAAWPQAAAPGAGPCGQRLLRFPPPDPSLALWQQMEPLLELLQLEGQSAAAATAGNEGQQPAATGPGAAAGLEPRTGRPPLPRPPRQRITGAATGAGSAATASGIPSSSSSSSGLSQRPPGLAPSGPLTSRNGARGGTGGTCRYESLDSLQHLSLDGFLRSWLPSYANFSRVLQIPAAQQQQGGVGEGSGRTAAEAGGSGVGLGPGRLCYISVYRLQLPRWHKLCEVHAGCMYEVELPAGAEPPGGVAEMSSSSSVPAAGSGAAPASMALPPLAARPAVAVPRAPSPVQVQFSTRCSSAAAAAAAGPDATTFADDDGAVRRQLVCPDLRRGSLSLVASVEDPGLVKLLWSERQRPNAQGQPQYGSIFPTVEDAADSGVDPTAAEVEMTLSPTRSQFRVVPHVRGGAVLQVISPRTVVTRPRQPGSGPPSPSRHAAAAPTAPSPRSPGHYFFWLQQEWSAREAAAAATASQQRASPAAPAGDAGPESGAEELELDAVAPGGGGGSAGRAAASRDRGCRALAEHLQALLECPPEFDPHKHGNRVRCSSTPLQLGPLPLALVEEIMRASGRELHPDGTLALATTPRDSGSRSALSVAAAAAAAAATAAAGRSTPASSASFGTTDAAAGSRQRGGPQQSVGGGGAVVAGVVSGGGGTSAGGLLRRGAAAALQREQRAGDGSVADSCNLALSRLPNSCGGSRIGSASSSSTPIPSRSASGTAAASSTAAAAVAAGGDASSRALASERRDVLQGFVRTTYSRLPAVSVDSGGAAAAAEARYGSGSSSLGARLEAGRALSSHPLDDSDWESEWGSDCDSPTEGADAGDCAAHTPREGRSAGEDEDVRREEGGAAAGTTSGVADGSAAVTLDGSPASSPGGEATPTEAATCLPAGCARGGLAAAAAVAAAVGSSGASLVAAAVEPDSAAPCPEEPSLMFELD